MQNTQQDAPDQRDLSEVTSELRRIILGGEIAVSLVRNFLLVTGLLSLIYALTSIGSLSSSTDHGGSIVVLLSLLLSSVSLFGFAVLCILLRIAQSGRLN